MWTIGGITRRTVRSGIIWSTISSNRFPLLADSCSLSRSAPAGIAWTSIRRSGSLWPRFDAFLYFCGFGFGSRLLFNWKIKNHELSCYRFFYSGVVLHCFVVVRLKIVIIRIWRVCRELLRSADVGWLTSVMFICNCVFQNWTSQLLLLNTLSGIEVVFLFFLCIRYLLFILHYLTKCPMKVQNGYFGHTSLWANRK